MSARTILAASASLLVVAGATAPAAAADFGISFHYSGSTPRCYVSSYYSSCAPRTYVYYDSDDCYDHYAPLTYVPCSTPRVVVYDDCYPTTYRTTYTRSRCYTRPVRHSRVKVHYRSGHRTYHHRKHITHRRYHAAPRHSMRIHHGDRVSHYRPSILRQRHRDVYRRHPSPHRRVRVYRR